MVVEVAMFPLQQIQTHQLILGLLLKINQRKPIMEYPGEEIKLRQRQTIQLIHPLLQLVTLPIVRLLPLLQLPALRVVVAKVVIPAVAVVADSPAVLADSPAVAVVAEEVVHHQPLLRKNQNQTLFRNQKNLLLLSQLLLTPFLPSKQKLAKLKTS
jgi:hypothetical protein